MNVLSIIEFLTHLKQNNNREWFSENKSKFDSCKKYFDEIAKNLITEISTFDDEIKHIDVKDCVFRIYRDIRFSHDKTPYKTHFGVFIAPAGGRKSQHSGYYLHLDPDGSFIASGVWCPEPKLLKALRKSVFDNIDEFNAICNSPEFKSRFNHFFDEDKLKKLPSGYPTDFEYAEFLKLKHYMVEYKLDNDLLMSDNFVESISSLFKITLPLNSFLNYTVKEVLYTE